MGFSLLERATGVIRSLRESHATLEQGNGETLIAQREERIKTAADQIATFHQLPYGAFEETAKNVFKKPDPSIPLIRLVRLNEQRFLVELELTERTDALRLGHSQAGKYWLDKVGETETIDLDTKAYIQRRLSYVGKVIPH